MRDTVKAAFLDFTVPLEGEVYWMYPDVKNLVSTGIGNLIDPIGLALNVPFVWPDGRAATTAEIAEEWNRVKNLPPRHDGATAAQLGHLYAKSFTRLRLTAEGLNGLVMGKLAQMDAFLATRFPEYVEWSADAQLGTLSMAWACGPAFRFPKLAAALQARDFRTAAVECFMPEERTISGLRPRNRVNRVLFLNAAVVQEAKLDPDELQWPADLESGIPTEREPSAVRPDQLEEEPRIVHAFPDWPKPDPEER